MPLSFRVYNYIASEWFRIIQKEKKNYTQHWARSMPLAAAAPSSAVISWPLTVKLHSSNKNFIFLNFKISISPCLSVSELSLAHCWVIRWKGRNKKKRHLGFVCLIFISKKSVYYGRVGKCLLWVGLVVVWTWMQGISPCFFVFLFWASAAAACTSTLTAVLLELPLAIAQGADLFWIRFKSWPKSDRQLTWRVLSQREMQWKWKAWLHTPHATVQSSDALDDCCAWHSMHKSIF